MQWCSIGLSLKQCVLWKGSSRLLQHQHGIHVIRTLGSPGEGMIRAHRPEQLTVVVQGDGDDLDVGPVMAESPVGHRPPRRAPNEAAPRPPPAQQSLVMRDSMALFLQVQLPVTHKCPAL